MVNFQNPTIFFASLPLKTTKAKTAASQPFSMYLHNVIEVAYALCNILLEVKTIPKI